MRQWQRPSIVQIMGCRLVDAKPLSEPMLVYCVNWNVMNKRQWNSNRNSNIYIQENAFGCIVWKMAAIFSALYMLTYIVQDYFGPMAVSRLFQGQLTHWSRVTHICVGNLPIIGSDNGLSPGRRQVIIWTNVGIWLIGPLGTNFSEILAEIITFLFNKMNLKKSSA